MKRSGVKWCVYGHLHGMKAGDAKEGVIEGIEFRLTSSDYLGFDLALVKNSR